MKGSWVRWVVLVAAAATALVALGASLTRGPLTPDLSTRRATTDARGGSSGIRGTVFFGGPCDEGAPCGSGEPIRATQDVYRYGSRVVVTTFTSSKNGRFEVPLPPGKYLIVQSLNHPAPGMMRPIHVIVEKGEFVRMNLAYDNGMR